MTHFLLHLLATTHEEKADHHTLIVLSVTPCPSCRPATGFVWISHVVVIANATSGDAQLQKY